MALLEEWRELAYGEGLDAKSRAKLWKDYFAKEKSIYEELLSSPETAVEGTVKELAEKYGTDIKTMTGFLDGINDSLKKPNPIEKMKESTKVRLEIVPETLYKNMVAAKADWLYNLPQWEPVIPAERRKELAREQRMSGTVVKDKKVGRNDPCPCGSGKKYKHCCGRNA